jgi:trimeric autotransporter adhesin
MAIKRQVPGLNRGSGMLAGPGFLLGRTGVGHGPIQPISAQQLALLGLHSIKSAKGAGQAIATSTSAANNSASISAMSDAIIVIGASALSSVTSLSTGVSSSLSSGLSTTVSLSTVLGNVSGSISAALSAATSEVVSLSTAVSTLAGTYSRQVPTTGFSITIGNTVNSLILNPAGTLATGTITMPASPLDGQQVGIASSQIVTALTVQANAGQTIDGGLTAATLAANGFAKWQYVLADTRWYRVG